MDGAIGVGDAIVCRVNGTRDIYVIGTVADGRPGDLKLSDVTTMAGVTAAIDRAYSNRTPDQRVWLFDGSAPGYVRTVAPRAQLYR